MGLSAGRSRCARLPGLTGAVLALMLGSAVACAAGADDSYQRGVAALNAGDMVTAMSEFTAALEAKPAHAPSAFARGKLFLTIGEPRLAVADFTAAILSGGPDARAYAWRGQAKANLKDDAGAIADFDEAIALAPRDADVLVIRAAYFLKKGMIGKARDDLTRAKAAAAPPQAAVIEGFIERLEGRPP